MHSVTMKWTRTPMLLLIFGSVLLITAAANLLLEDDLSATEVKNDRRCIHDEIMNSVIESGIHRVKTQHTTSRHRLASEASVSDEWRPIRIKYFVEDLLNSSRYCTNASDRRPNFEGGKMRCGDDQILTPEKKDILINISLPEAVRAHSDRLLVRPLVRPLKVPTFKSRSICGSFSIPSSHTKDGVSDTDFIVYVAAGTMEDNVVAWATACALDEETGRPVVGVINVSPRYISSNLETVRTIAHEILHSLGFSKLFFDMRNMLRMTSTRDGAPLRPVLVSPRVVAAARKQYGCNSLEWMELENEGGSGSAISHWEQRIAIDELMSPMEGIGHYTILTLAAMEDLGFYRANYSRGEVMTWGRNAGCELLTEKCVENGDSVAPSMFCTDDVSLRCTSDRTSSGRCTIKYYREKVYSYYNYFNHDHIIGSSNYVDHCPVVSRSESLSCRQNTASDIPGWINGNNSFCMDTVDTNYIIGNHYLNALCVEVACNSSALTYGVKVAPSTDFTQCPPGEMLSLRILSTLYERGELACPQYCEVCRCHEHELHN